jgi:type 1 glutamine amidotransferase
MTRRSVLLALTAGALPAAKRIRVLILTGSSDEPYHHWRETTTALTDVLDGAGLFETRAIDDVHPRSGKEIRGSDLVFLNYNGPRFPAVIESELENFIRRGGGFAAFHLASYGEFFGMVFETRWRDAGEGWTEFPKIIGAKWEAGKIGHAKRTTFDVEWVAKSHPIASTSFSTDDELYHRLTILPGTEVLAHAKSPAALGGTGNYEPMIWVNRYGKGRVFYTTLGHDVRALTQPGVQQALIRGLEWAATGKVTYDK